MKKLLLILSLAYIGHANAQPYVLIPDGNFASYLQTIVPAAMHGDSLNTTHTLVTTTTHSIIVISRSIADLSGVQYFTSLTYLDCQQNYPHLINISILPNSLTYLDCHSNSLTSLPILPNSLTYFNCSGQNNGSYCLTSLPSLPNSLTYLSCYANSLTTLPALPNSITYLDCNSNTLTSLPALPNSLTKLTCYQNTLTSLPALPNTLTHLFCDYNSLASLPSLPNTLQSLLCDNNSLASLPSLPNTLQTLYCDNNSLTTLPALPNSLQTLRCISNLLTTLPTLPNSLQSLYCYNNNIVCFPTFPSSILPPWNNYPYGYDYYINIDPNPYNCLPNYLPNAMDPTDLAVPICVIGNSNGCAVANDIQQVTYNNAQVTVYPNPTSDQFFIETNSTDKLTVDLYDVNGRHVFSKSVSDKSNINVTTLNEGIYTLSIKTADRVINKKLVILR